MKHLIIFIWMINGIKSFIIPNFNKISEESPKKITEITREIPIISHEENLLECEHAHKHCMKPNPLLMGNSFCHCNSKCYKYGDCCWDSAHDKSDQVIRVKFECIRLKDEKDSPAYYMISHCPSHWLDQKTKSWCEEVDLYPDDLLLYIPVTSKSNYYVYRNVFCAMCNNVHNVQAWTPYTSCYNRSLSCLVTIVPPDLIPKPKECDWHGIFVCHHGSSSVRYNCATYYAPVKYTDSNGIEYIYKNKFCAFCAGLTEDQLQCSIRYSLRKELNLELSIAILLDVDFIQGGIIVGNTNRCPEGNIYDPWKKKCRSIYCGKLFYYKDGKCVKLSSRNGDNDLIWTNGSLDKDCAKLSIEKNSYIIYENGTMVLLEDRTVFPSGSYEISNNESILICAQNESIKKFSEGQTYLTIICLSMSISCLILKILLFITHVEQHKLSTVLMFYLSLSLFFAQLLFLIGEAELYKPLCIIIAVSTHYFFLVTIFCSNVLAFDIWKTFTNLNRTPNYKFKYLPYYSLYCWGIPSIIVLSAAITEWAFRGKFSPKYGQYVCWISNRFALLIFFAIPSGIILLANVVLFIVTAFSIVKASKSTKVARENAQDKRNFRFLLYIKLALIMGLSWIFGFISAYSNSNVLWYLFIILNGLQGAFILAAFTRIDTIKQFIRKVPGKETIYNCGLKASHISIACITRSKT
ncbi:probable G-protein coupled receptor Mth-like 3 [Centruroides vittatus]|uniref:probable G-protein coupled receptor Mth-like 3 n=1 Tax=Centruroides vittatus TaxID=120091 RepID=UPI00350FEEC6